ncbi:hypothetical protein NDU88_008747 [Pleurodeles waltl]|uniref:Uncharacterized protein n=1 Tax=Pleurodeles waltl TaxID=8319 RepID=A0AAV7PRA2_PLEWA|nr:hypothetical protein NDU88_008747 [Pleurodeles waltl]
MRSTVRTSGFVPQMKTAGLAKTVLSITDNGILRPTPFKVYQTPLRNTHIAVPRGAWSGHERRWPPRSRALLGGGPWTGGGGAGGALGAPRPVADQRQMGRRRSEAWERCATHGESALSPFKTRPLKMA